ncbi:DNA repair protein RecO [Virgibacillus halodenitrificans]|uniref:DNA repair protein RecO n=1 Tax=Virgibacillus halodenitrificans TaxID=1482 RepID=UPI00136F4374|nr:DNA repair protein RecO [Virgibacillus halodenitrificans]MYL46609.1 DNA repair protein RecO [Virgibacillus halodenitrificans]
MLEKVDGVILKTQDYGETHKIITIYSRKLGKISTLARGAKKTKSRMAAVTQPFIYGNFFVYLNKGLSTIQQGEIEYSFRAIREDIFKTAYTAYITELTDKIVDPQITDPFLFEELYQTMSWIEEHEDVEIPIMMYELKMFVKGGFGPMVNGCANCNNKEFPYAFSIAEGGLLCKRCRYLDEKAIPLPDSVSKLLHLFTAVELKRIGTISVKSENRQLIRKILDAYYEQYGGYFLKSKRFLRQLDLLK